MLGKKIKKIIVGLLLSISLISGIFGFKMYKENQVIKNTNRIILKEKAEYMRAINDYQKLNQDSKLIEQTIKKCFDLRLVKIDYRHQSIAEDGGNIFGMKHISRQRIIDMTYTINVILEDFNDIKVEQDFKNMQIIIHIPDKYNIELGKTKDDSKNTKQSPLANPFSADYIQGLEDSIKDEISTKMNEALSKNKIINGKNINIKNSSYNTNKGLLSNTKDNFVLGMEELTKQLGLNNIVFK